eukprot:g6372.t1
MGCWGGTPPTWCEDQWTTLMFFCEVDKGRGRDKAFEKLAIFGTTRARRGAELLVLSAVETKVPGYFASIKEEEYMKWLFMQLEGPVWVDNWEDRDDITVLDIPSDCIGYEEWGTLMFFMTKPGSGGKGDRRGGAGFGEQLAILGPERGRRGAELKVMSSVEEKAPGQYTRGIREKFSDSRGFATDRMIFKDDELSYALGKQGSTRKKLALASGCIIQYVGHVCFLAGTMAERRRAKARIGEAGSRCLTEKPIASVRQPIGMLPAPPAPPPAQSHQEFLDWLLQQRRGQVTVNNISERDDVTEVFIPENCKGWVTGNRGSELRRMEMETGTYMFMALDKRGEDRFPAFRFDHALGCLDPAVGSALAQQPSHRGRRSFGVMDVDDLILEHVRIRGVTTAARARRRGDVRPLLGGAPTRAEGLRRGGAPTRGDEWYDVDVQTET